MSWKACRCACEPAGWGLLYALGTSVFGGTTQFVVTWLIRATGNPMAPAWYMSGAVALAWRQWALMRETAPVKEIKAARVRALFGPTPQAADIPVGR